MPGIHNGKIQQLQDLVASYSRCERYVAVAFDEMKIKSSLVFDNNSGEIIGFTDLGDPELTFSSFDNDLPVATTAIAFLVRGLMTSLKFIFVIFLPLELQHPFKSSHYSGKLCQSWSSR